MPRDLYSRLDDVDAPTLRSIADVLELRGRHPRQAAIRRAYLDHVPADVWRGSRVLEVGCGTGPVTRDIARRVGPGGTVVGVDPTRHFVEIARALAARDALQNVGLAVADGRALPHGDGAFDVVLAVTVLCHLPDRVDVLREIARVVRPGGHVLIVDGDYASNQIEHPDLALTERIVAAWRANVVDDPYLVRRLVPLVEQVGLTVEQVDGHIHVEAGRVDEATSFIWQWAVFAQHQALQAGAVSDREAERWLDGVRRHNAAGTLFGSVSYVSVLARRP